MASNLDILFRVAADISGLTDATKGINSKLDEIGSVAGTLGKTLAAAFTVTAIVGVGKQVVDFASDLTDLSAKTGISTTGLQKLQIAFQDSGVSLDTVIGASEKLGQKLFSGDKGAIAALDKLGLKAGELKQMSVDQMFITVADAVGRIENPAEQAYAKLALFGKADILAGLNGDLAETVAKADELNMVIGEDTIAAADQLGDQIGILSTQFLAITAEAIGPLLPLLSELGAMLMWLAKEVIGPVLNFAIKGFLILLADMWAGIAETLGWLAKLGSKIPGVGGKFKEMEGWLNESAAGAKNFITNIDLLGTHTEKAGGEVRKATPHLIGLGTATDEAAKKAKDMAEAQKDIRAAMIPLTATQQAQVKEWQKLGISVGDMAKALGISSTAIQNQIADWKVMEQEIPVVRAAAADFAALFPSQFKDANAEIERMKIGFGNLKEPIGNAKDSLTIFGDTAAEEVPPKLSKVQEVGTQVFDDLAVNFSGNLSAMLTGMQGFHDTMKGIWRGIQTSIANVLADILYGEFKKFLTGMLNSILTSKAGTTAAFEEQFSGLDSVLGDMGEQVKGWIGGVKAQIAGLVGAIGGVIGLIESTSTKAATLSGALTGAGIGTMIAPGIGTAIGAGVGAVAGAIVGIARGGEEGMVVNPAREKWFGEHGGTVEGVAERLAAADIFGEDARRMIEAVFQADTAREFDAAIGRFGGIPGFALGGLVKQPTIGMVGEAGPELITPLSMLSKLTDREFVIHNYIDVDGRTMARTTARHLPGVLATQGIPT